LFLQSGTPGFEYARKQMSPHIHFIGPLLPYGTEKHGALSFEQKLFKYEKRLLVTQGTFEGDVNKLIVPTIEAFKNSHFLLIVTTAGWHTGTLRERYKSFDNIVIEDFIPFSQVMPRADVFISNGGYGGVMQSICHKLPMVLAGIHEGKNEICARVGYFKLGINLRTEKPSSSKIAQAVATVLQNTDYQQNVERLSAEFSSYNPLTLCQSFIERMPAINKQLSSTTLS
jgi:UDP:flavonoid glycosyltransferase YjiC (YdhE family)